MDLQEVAVGQEIERKFLVRDASVVDGAKGIDIRQGYLSTEPARVVRIRRAGERAYVTIKGESVGASRAEYEYPIPAGDADEMLDRLCLRPLVEKTRHEIERDGLVWEVDVFRGDNEGLVIAEVELPAEDHAVDLPDWIDRDVTVDARYYNANLVAHPFKDW